MKLLKHWVAAGEGDRWRWPALALTDNIDVDSGGRAEAEESLSEKEGEGPETKPEDEVIEAKRLATMTIDRFAERVYGQGMDNLVLKRYGGEKKFWSLKNWRRTRGMFEAVKMRFFDDIEQSEKGPRQLEKAVRTLVSDMLEESKERGDLKNDKLYAAAIKAVKGVTKEEDIALADIDGAQTLVAYLKEMKSGLQADSQLAQAKATTAKRYVWLLGGRGRAALNSLVNWKDRKPSTLNLAPSQMRKLQNRRMLSASTTEHRRWFPEDWYTEIPSEKDIYVQSTNATVKVIDDLIAKIEGPLQQQKAALEKRQTMVQERYATLTDEQKKLFVELAHKRIHSGGKAIFAETYKKKVRGRTVKRPFLHEKMDKESEKYAHVIGVIAGADDKDLIKILKKLGYDQREGREAIQDSHAEMEKAGELQAKQHTFAKRVMYGLHGDFEYSVAGVSKKENRIYAVAETLRQNTTPNKTVNPAELWKKIHTQVTNGGAETWGDVLWREDYGGIMAKDLHENIGDTKWPPEVGLGLVVNYLTNGRGGSIENKLASLGEGLAEGMLGYLEGILGEAEKEIKLSPAVEDIQEEFKTEYGKSKETLRLHQVALRDKNKLLEDSSVSGSSCVAEDLQKTISTHKDSIVRIESKITKISSKLAADNKAVDEWKEPLKNIRIKLTNLENYLSAIMPLKADHDIVRELEKNYLDDKSNKNKDSYTKKDNKLTAKIEKAARISSFPECLNTLKDRYLLMNVDDVDYLQWGKPKSNNWKVLDHANKVSQTLDTQKREQQDEIKKNVINTLKNAVMKLPEFAQIKIDGEVFTIYKKVENEQLILLDKNGVAERVTFDAGLGKLRGHRLKNKDEPESVAAGTVAKLVEPKKVAFDL